MRPDNNPSVFLNPPLIHLNGSKNRTFLQYLSDSPNKKKLDLKNHIDLILQKDFSNWNLNPNKFDAIHSFTAQSTHLINTYVQGIYSDYHIQDPLDQRNRKLAEGNQQHLLFKNEEPSQQAKFASDSVFTLEKSPYKPIQRKTLYETPTKFKSHKKGLELTNSRASKEKLSISIPKLTPQKPSPKDQLETTPIKWKLFQKTAPSPDTSFALTNSKNNGWVPTEMGFSGVKNFPTRDSLLFNSKVSHQNKPQENIFSAYFLENEKGSQQNGRQTAEFRSTREFQRGDEKEGEVRRKKEGDFMASEVSLGENNPERNERMEKLKYAESFINVGRKRTLFDVKESVSQSFRYCVGCENAILEANIGNHQEKCEGFQKIFKLNRPEEIVKQLDSKIMGIAQKMIQKQSQINAKDHTQIIKSTNHLKEVIQKMLTQIRVEDILKSEGFTKEYDEMMQIGKRWGHLTDEANKLKWFLLIKRNFETLKLQNVKEKYKQK